MLRTLSNLESGFLARSLNRMYEPINAAFPSYGGASRVPAGRTENLLVVLLAGKFKTCNLQCENMKN
jgi:hypothetical protein